jgi:hypothetical protein
VLSAGIARAAAAEESTVACHRDRASVSASAISVVQLQRVQKSFSHDLTRIRADRIQNVRSMKMFILTLELE